MQPPNKRLRRLKPMPKQGKRAQKAMPCLAAALICEQISEESDQVASVNRIVDTVNLQNKEVTRKGTTVQLPVSMFIAFKSAGFEGNMDLQLQLVDPAGIMTSTLTIKDVEFNGPPESGVAYRMPSIGLTWGGEGLYWFILSLGEMEYTRIPLRIQYSTV
jgi:hypothetical protein